MMHFLNSHAFQWFLVVGAIVTVIGRRLHALLNALLNAPYTCPECDGKGYTEIPTDGGDPIIRLCETCKGDFEED